MATAETRIRPACLLLYRVPRRPRANSGELKQTPGKLR